MSQKQEKLINKEFASDIYTQNMIYGITVRSEIHKGKIESVTLPELKKGYSIISYKDIPGNNLLEVFGKKMPFLAEIDIDYYGQPVLLIAGPDKNELGKIKKQIKIEYTEEKPVFDFTESGQEVLLTLSKGDAINEINIADKVIECEYNIPPDKNHFLETQSTYTDTDNQTIIVYSSTAYPFHVRDSVSEITGLPKTRVRVIGMENAGSMDQKIIFPSLLAGHCALITQITNKPVKMIYSRNENTSPAISKLPVIIKYKTALDKNKKLSGMIIKIKIDSGAYSLISPLVLKRIIVACSGAYSCENISITAYNYKTNKTPSFYFSGLGESQAFFALELHASKMAKKSAMDPYTWKINNLTQQNFPSGMKIKNIKMPFSVLEDVVNRSDFIRKYGAYEFNRKNRINVFTQNTLKRGIGISLNFHGIGIPEITNSEINYTVKTVLDKNRKFHIYSSITNKEDCNIYRNIASGILKVPMSSIIIEKCDTAAVPDSGPPICSNSINIICKLLIQCCNVVKTKSEKVKLPIEIRKTFKQKKAPVWNESKITNNYFPELAWEATVVEVEINPVLLKPEITGIWVSHYSGDEVLKGQYRKKIDRDLIKNLEFAVFNHNIFNEYSSLLNIKDIITTKVKLIESNLKQSALKLTGPGDQAVTGFAPAYTNAVSQAIGCEINKLPVYPEFLESIINKENINEN